MNAQNPRTTDVPSTITTSEQTLDYIAALSEDTVFTPESIQNEATQGEPTDITAGELVRIVLKYSGWIFNSFVKWLFILIVSSMAIGPAFESITSIILGHRSGTGTFINTAAFCLTTAFVGFLIGRDRDFAKRICQAIAVGTLLLLGGGLWVLIQPNGNTVMGLLSVAAQLITLAIAVGAGSRIPRAEKKKTKKGFLRQSASTIVGILIGFTIALSMKFSVAYLGTLAQNSLHKGKPAPATQYVDIDDNPFVFADCKGKVTLVEFWAPGCGPCVASMPHLQSIHQRYGDRDDFAMVSIAVSSNHDEATKVFEDKGCEWQLLFKPKSDKGEPDDSKPNPNVSPEFQPQGIPSAYIIDRDGNVAAAGIRGSEIDTKLAELLNNQTD